MVRALDHCDEIGFCTFSLGWVCVCQDVIGLAGFVALIRTLSDEFRREGGEKVLHIIPPVRRIYTAFEEQGCVTRTDG